MSRKFGFRVVLVLALFTAGWAARWAMRPDGDALPSRLRPVNQQVQTKAADIATGTPGLTDSAGRSLAEWLHAEPALKAPNFVRFLEGANIDEVRSAFEALVGMSTQGSGWMNELHSMLFLRWLELDPADALASVRAADSHLGKSKLFSVWLEVDPDAAIEASDRDEAWLYLLPQIVQSNEGIHRILTRHPDKVDQLLRHSVALDDGSRVRQVMAVWAKLDPEAALTAAEGLYQIRDREYAKAAVYAHLAETQPEEVRKIHAQLPAGSFRNELAAVVARSMAKADWKTAVDWVSSLKEGDEQRTAYRALIGGALESDPARAIDLIDQVGQKIRYLDTNDRNAFHRLLEDMAKDDLGRALHLAAQLPATGPSELEPLMGERDPEELAGLAAGLPSGEVRDQVQRLLTERWARQDLAGAQKFVLAITDPVEQRDCSHALVSVAVREQPDAVFEWANGLPHPLAESVVAEAFGSFVEMDPEEAYDRLDSVTDPVVREEAIRTLVRSYAWERNDKKVELLEELPVRDQEEFASNIAGLYTIQDPRAASKWIAELPSGRGRDRAIAAMIKSLTYGHRSVGVRDYEGAFYWAQVIEDPEIRATHLSIAAFGWRNEDPANARKAIEESSILSQDEKESFLSRFEK